MNRPMSLIDFTVYDFVSEKVVKFAGGSERECYGEHTEGLNHIISLWRFCRSIRSSFPFVTELLNLQEGNTMNCPILFILLIIIMENIFISGSCWWESTGTQGKKQECSESHCLQILTRMYQDITVKLVSQKCLQGKDRLCLLWETWGCVVFFFLRFWKAFEIYAQLLIPVFLTFLSAFLWTYFHVFIK